MWFVDLTISGIVQIGFYDTFRRKPNTFFKVPSINWKRWDKLIALVLFVSTTHVQTDHAYQVEDNVSVSKLCKVPLIENKTKQKQQ